MFQNAAWKNKFLKLNMANYDGGGIRVHSSPQIE